MLSSGQQGPLLEAPQRYRALERWLKGVSSYPRATSWKPARRKNIVAAHLFVMICSLEQQSLMFPLRTDNGIFTFVFLPWTACAGSLGSIRHAT